VRDGLTANPRFFVRNHFAMPAFDAVTFRLEVGGRIQRPLRLGLDELHAMPVRSYAATIECAGKGRGGFDPGFGRAMGAWCRRHSDLDGCGVPLAAVLERAGVLADASEVLCRGADGGVPDGQHQRIRYERSLPLEHARAPAMCCSPTR
jgi:DMSO/TMAO reductase YedYZ molybdopterin-dependent catalytic subunit